MFHSIYPVPYVVRDQEGVLTVYDSVRANCSVKMSFHERTDIDDEGAEEDTGIERSERRTGDWGTGGRADGIERAPYAATSGSVQEATVLKVKRNDRRLPESGRARVSDA